MFLCHEAVIGNRRTYECRSRYNACHCGAQCSALALWSGSIYSACLLIRLSGSQRKRF